MNRNRLGCIVLYMVLKISRQLTVDTFEYTLNRNQIEPNIFVFSLRFRFSLTEILVIAFIEFGSGLVG